MTAEVVWQQILSDNFQLLTCTGATRIVSSRMTCLLQQDCVYIFKADLMNKPRSNLPYMNFSAEQAVAFQFRWDKLKCIIHQGNILRSRCETLKHEIATADKLFQSRVGKLSFFFTFLILGMLIKSYRTTDFMQDIQTEGPLVFLVTLLITMVIFLGVSFDFPSGLKEELNKLMVEIDTISTEFFVVSGGIGWTRYLSDDPLGFTAPTSDPNFMDLKISIAQRCLWQGDFQRDPDLLRVVWVRG